MRYEWVTNEMEEEALQAIVDEGGSVLMVPGVFEILREHYNNEILERLEEQYPDEYERDKYENDWLPAVASEINRIDSNYVGYLHQSMREDDAYWFTSFRDGLDPSEAAMDWLIEEDDGDGWADDTE